MASKPACNQAEDDPGDDAITDSFVSVMREVRGLVGGA